MKKNILINSGRTSPFLNTRNDLIKNIDKEKYNVFVTGSEEGFEDQLEEIGVTFIKTEVDRTSLNPLKDIKLILQYYNIMKKNNIDIVHSYTIKPNIYGSIAARLANIPTIIPTLNGIGYIFTEKSIKTLILKSIVSKLYKFAFKSSRKVIFQNVDDAKEFSKHKIVKPENITVVNGSGINLFQFPFSKVTPKASFVLTTRLLKSKGVMDYLKAAEIIKKDYPNIQFTLVGPTDPNPNGIRLEHLQYYIENDIVKYLGKRNDIQEILKDHSVFVLPSYYREGVPHSILEAMAVGRVILTTNSPGCRETVIEGKNGFLVPIKDFNYLAEKMKWLIENNEKIPEMGYESYKYAKSKFEVNLVNDKIYDSMGIK